MITLAQIIAINVDTNLCEVRVPILENAGSTKQVTLWATMMLPPGIHSGYEKDDVVFVSFADNSLSRPVVLGQLYRGAALGTQIDQLGESSDKIDKATAFSCVDLDATGKVSIPLYTKLTGNTLTSVLTINDLYDYIKTLQADVATLQTKVSNLETSLATLQTKVSNLETSLATLRTENNIKFENLTSIVAGLTALLSP